MPELHLIKGKEYKVQDNDTLDSIAKANGLTWQQLAKFNWGTEDEAEVNMKLRDKVGSRKRSSTDDTKFILSKDDDPGLIYIPETPKAPQTYASNSTTTLSVKLPTKKTFKTSKCLVVFRPDPAWKGEWGFDWLRDGDWGKGQKFKPPLLDGGYKAGVKTGMTGAEAETALKAKYDILPTVVKVPSRYRIGLLNIFPQNLGGTNPPPDTCKLKLSIKIEEEKADTLKIVLPTYDDSGTKKDYFSLVSGSLDLPTAVGNHNATLELKCIKEYSAQQEIKIVAETRETDGTYKTYDAGKLIALPNDASRRKSMKMVFIKVLTDVRDTGVPDKGDFDATEKDNLLKALFQPLMLAEFEDAPDFDLSTNDDFKRKTSAGKKGKFYTRKDKAKTGLNQDDKDFYPTVKSLFLAEGTNSKYASDFLIFAFGVRPYDKALGQVQGIGVHNLIVFPKRDKCTVNHEALHGLGLRHSFKDDVNQVDPDNIFTFQQGKTDNVMDYTYDDSALIVWSWQWKIVNP